MAPMWLRSCGMYLKADMAMSAKLVADGATFGSHLLLWDVLYHVCVEVPAQKNDCYGLSEQTYVRRHGCEFQVFKCDQLLHVVL